MPSDPAHPISISILEFLPLLYMLRAGKVDKTLGVIFGTAGPMAIGTFLMAPDHVGIWLASRSPSRPEGINLQ